MPKSKKIIKSLFFHSTIFGFVQEQNYLFFKHFATKNTNEILSIYSDLVLSPLQIQQPLRSNARDDLHIPHFLNHHTHGDGGLNKSEGRNSPSKLRNGPQSTFRKGWSLFAPMIRRQIHDDATRQFNSFPSTISPIILVSPGRTGHYVAICTYLTVERIRSKGLCFDNRAKFTLTTC